MTLKQKRFIKEFIKHGNATKAARIAYRYTNNNTCSATGSRLLRNVKVQEEIAKYLQSEGLNLQLVLKSLKTNLVKGAGVNAKASDSNRAAELLLKVAGAFEQAKQQPTVQYNRFYVDMNMSEEEMLAKRGEMKGFFDKVLDGEGTHTPQS